MKITKARLIIAALAVGASAIFGPATQVSALNGSQFKAGRIIDDKVFYNKSAMSVADIQNFLNSKVPTCDTWGTKPSEYGGGTRADYGRSKGVPPPFTCVKDYWQNPTTGEDNYGGKPIPAGAKSAAQIIWDASQQYNINPQVLLTLIHKEAINGILIDEWPWPIQYKTVTGYACPDSGPNNSANCNSAYYGFSNQVTSAAYQFRRYATYPNQYNFVPGQSNFIQWSPNASCGGAQVFIENQATASLYNYTPYQPNAAALNNLYGTGDSCSAYGNRNFWRIFSDWFGNTYGSPISGAVYRLHNPYTQDWLLTLDPIEKAVAIQFNNYILDDGVAFQGFLPQESGNVAVHRLSKANTHLYSASQAEINAAVSQYGFIDEGLAFYAKPNQTANSRAVYRLTKSGKYLYTVNVFEKDEAIQRGYAYEGIAFYSYSESTKLPVYRTSKDGRYLFTNSGDEKKIALQSGYVDEGVAFEAQTAVTGDAMPVYRLVRNNTRLFTMSAGERDAAVLLYGYRSEGVGFYAYKPDYAAQQVFRLSNSATSGYLLTHDATERQSAVTTYKYNDEGKAFSH